MQCCMWPSRAASGVACRRGLVVGTQFICGCAGAPQAAFWTVSLEEIARIKLEVVSLGSTSSKVRPNGAEGLTQPVGERAQRLEASTAAQARIAETAHLGLGQWQQKAARRVRRGHRWNDADTQSRSYQREDRGQAVSLKGCMKLRAPAC